MRIGVILERTKGWCKSHHLSVSCRGRTPRHARRERRRFASPRSSGQACSMGKRPSCININGTQCTVCVRGRREVRQCPRSHRVVAQMRSQRLRQRSKVGRPNTLVLRASQTCLTHRGKMNGKPHSTRIKKSGGDANKTFWMAGYCFAPAASFVLSSDCQRSKSTSAVSHWSEGWKVKDNSRKKNKPFSSKNEGGKSNELCEKKRMRR